jgi:hypothetical protein
LSFSCLLFQNAHESRKLGPIRRKNDLMPVTELRFKFRYILFRRDPSCNV